MPNPDGTMTPEERQRALLSAQQTPVNPGYTHLGEAGGRHETQLGVDQAVARGSELGGSHQYDYGLGVQSSLFGNLSDAEALAKRQGDFGLGTNNNAPTAAMLGNAQATGDKYSGQFGTDASRAGDLSAAAGARGLGRFQGDTGAYDAATANAANDRALQTGAYNALMNFSNQGPGPSAAQAQLQQATNANTANALAMARSGRGMGGSAAALRGAVAQNALTQQGANAQAAELRANENTAFQAQRLSAMGQAGNVAGQVVTGDQGTGQLGLAGAQYATNTALQGTQLNDATSQAWAQQQMAGQQAGLGAEMGAQTQQLNLNATALAGRESEWASANQTHGIDTGNATQAGIADANRQQAYTGAALSGAAGVIAATSDERYKTNIQPLSNQGPAPLPNQAPAQSTDSLGPSKASQDSAAHAAEGSAIGGTAGSVAGGVIGSAVGGPVGGVLGSMAGNFAGKALGKLASDIRAKDNIQPLSYTRGAPLVDSDGEDPLMHYARLRGIPVDYDDADEPQQPAATQRDPHNPSRLISSYQPISDASRGAGGSKSAYHALLSIADQHGLSTAADQKDVAKYAKIPADKIPKADDGTNSMTGTGPDASKALGAGLSAAGQSLTSGPPSARAYQRFARDNSHPILSEGDALLADSARNAPGSIYQYKDPKDGAGTYVGPMAQDLAAHPVTRGAVTAEPGTGKLQVNGARLATVNTAQNHAQQNQLDALDAKLAELEGLLKGSSKYPEPQEPGAEATSDERYKRDTVKLSATPRGAPYPDYAPAKQSPYQPIADASRYAGRVTFRPTGSDPYPSNPPYQRAAR